MLLQENIFKINRKTYKTGNLRGLRSFAAVILHRLHCTLRLFMCGQFLCRYDNEKGRHRANKKASMLSLLEDGYLDAEDDEDTVRTHYAFFIVVHRQIICSFYYIYSINA